MLWLVACREEPDRPLAAPQPNPARYGEDPLGTVAGTTKSNDLEQPQAEN